MRIAIATCLLAAAVGCGAGASAPGAQTEETDLKITVWPEGRTKGDGRVYTLECAPAAGSLPRRATACSRLLPMAKPFAPVRKDMYCTDQYGGPQQALVTGTFEGARVWAMLSATDGCQIARAKRVAFLLPGFSTTGNA
jgi:hypothetical protein